MEYVLRTSESQIENKVPQAGEVVYECTSGRVHRTAMPEFPVVSPGAGNGSDRVVDESAMHELAGIQIDSFGFFVEHH